MTRQTGLLSLLFFALISHGAWSEDFRVEDIRVEGLQRITAGTVFNYLPVQPGDVISDTRTAELARSLFASGFFKDVRLERDGNVLIVVVEERPAIAEINFSGNKSIEDEQLREGLKDAGLSEGRTFNRSVLDGIEAELERQFFNAGKYAIKLKTTVTPLERNRVAIDITIVEGETARIKSINIIGNKAFDEDDLLDEFSLTTGGWLSSFTKDDQYSRQKLAGDLETLRSYYLDRGYVQFKITSTQVTITPDKHEIFVTINIDEGDVYTLSDIQLAGDYVGEAEEYFPLIHLTRGEPFNRKRVIKSSDRISSKLSDEGYAFANVNPIPEIDEENKTVAVTYFVDPGKRVYVRRLNIKGNDRTRDEVIRREFRQMEAAWFSSEKLKLSRERAQRTGYFERVSVETPAVPGSGDQVDIDVDVVEKPSGALLAGLGFSQADGVVLNASIQQDNFLGTGKKVSLALKTSSANQHYEVSYDNPYYTVDGISRGFTLSYRTTDFDELDTAEYKIDDGVVGMNFGIPLSEFNRFYFSTALHHIDFSANATTASTEIKNWEATEGSRYLNLELQLGWSHDSRDSAIFPNEGALQRLSAELTVPGSDLLYYKVSYKHRRYWPVLGDLVFSLNGDIGYGMSYGGTSSLPFFENYYGGGPTSVRGYAAHSLGPRDSNGDPLGGNARVIGNAELLMPAPYFSDSMRMLAFFDAGSVFDTSVNGFDTSEFRYSTGLGVSWLSPVGALTVSLAKPLKKDSQDEAEEFQFTFGTTF